ncbi:hypothetical protein L873DRAFT_1817073 [Choiromyces venosus 120613-1]|uniref:Uncharacterized protein n=1 Tax=Choiromyces venosus 120613-1 TaxID=1336337 RepID=A0A3N4J370_9PEZI|nr:hypothetical protein L873DRAFT_1817073 [Choiromyces venosus 120613-1]
MSDNHQGRPPLGGVLGGTGSGGPGSGTDTGTGTGGGNQQQQGMSGQFITSPSKKSTGGLGGSQTQIPQSASWMEVHYREIQARAGSALDVAAREENREYRVRKYIQYRAMAKAICQYYDNLIDAEKELDTHDKTAMRRRGLPKDTGDDEEQY